LLPFNFVMKYDVYWAPKFVMNIMRLKFKSPLLNPILVKNGGNI